MSIKNDFPIFANNPWLVYLDNAATTLKPKHVIDRVSTYLENDYANIHRWAYSLSERSEELYHLSKQTVAKAIWGKTREIIYTYNSTYAFNILASSLAKSGFLKKWDKILVSISEHHANIVPWLILKDEIWIEIDYVNITPEYDIDFEDFQKKYDDKVKLVSFTRASNVSWTVFDLHRLSKLFRPETLFAVDASQAIPNFKIDINEIRADFVAFTWHKIMAQTWIWVLWIKTDHLKKLTPAIWWGWSIVEVHKQDYSSISWAEWFEIGTPNLVGAVSLLWAFEYIEKIWWYDFVQSQEKKLTKYALDKFAQIKDKVTLVWKTTPENRIWVFSFVLQKQIPAIRIWELLAERWVCVRCWWHCAHPFLDEIWYHNWTCRMSLYIYNDEKDIDAFFESLEEIIK